MPADASIDVRAAHLQHRSGRSEQMGTRAMFLVAGLAMAAWAPLVPFAKARAEISEGSFGLVLLCLGLGSIAAMPMTGLLANRFGCRAVLVASTLVVAIVLPMLALADGVLPLALSLALFGAAIGTLDVAVNIQAVMVEKDSGRTMMSGFHGLFSLGGILGAGGVSLLMQTGLAPVHATLVVSAASLLLLATARPGLLPYGNREAGAVPFAVLPRGVVAVIGILCFVVFLAEGAILDWSALFLIEAHGLDTAAAGFGYAAFAIAMTIGRLTGDAIVRTLGGTRVLIIGSLVSVSGFVLTVAAPTQATALAGFLLVGLGASNIVPVLFTAAGAQTRMRPSHAIAAVTTIGYAGILMGPALIGGIAELLSLGMAFLVIALSMSLPGLVGPRTLRS